MFKKIVSFCEITLFSSVLAAVLLANVVVPLAILFVPGFGHFKNCLAPRPRHFCYEIDSTVYRLLIDKVGYALLFLTIFSLVVVIISRPPWRQASFPPLSFSKQKIANSFKKYGVKGVKRGVFFLGMLIVLSIPLTLDFIFKNVVPQVQVSREPNAVKNFSETLAPVSRYYLVARVIDGDTFELDNGEKVRLIGVDAPESVDPRRTIECFGTEASQHLATLLTGKNVRLEKDVSETDRYNRLLRYVYLEDGTFVNLSIVQSGYAVAATYPPDIKYSSRFVEAEQHARINKNGLWAKCKQS